ncbi:hypothetical protein K470DRAFT_260907 [Piedraia hortae CBS 480.64]|uniref:Uncharacterized protein n=1 Tax=Piedraia hortae CBS 480.64 TaxID=1314780 RepID=A0A6A7BRG5_9PEZI|nr:hypothetical protein K470DRAFT_260907 [Piedraia hortae CBS 480.64]
MMNIQHQAKIAALKAYTTCNQQPIEPIRRRQNRSSRSEGTHFEEARRKSTKKPDRPHLECQSQPEVKTQPKESALLSLPSQRRYLGNENFPPPNDDQTTILDPKGEEEEEEGGGGGGGEEESGTIRRRAPKPALPVQNSSTDVVESPIQREAATPELGIPLLPPRCFKTRIRRVLSRKTSLAQRPKIPEQHIESKKRHYGPPERRGSGVFSIERGSLEAAEEYRLSLPTEEESERYTLSVQEVGGADEMNRGGTPQPADHPTSLEPAIGEASHALNFGSVDVSRLKANYIGKRTPRYASIDASSHLNPPTFEACTPSIDTPSRLKVDHPTRDHTPSHISIDTSSRLTSWTDSFVEGSIDTTPQGTLREARSFSSMRKGSFSTLRRKASNLSTRSGRWLARPSKLALAGSEEARGLYSALRRRMGEVKEEDWEPGEGVLSPVHESILSPVHETPTQILRTVDEVTSHVNEGVCDGGNSLDETTSRTNTEVSGSSCDGGFSTQKDASPTSVYSTPKPKEREWRKWITARARPKQQESSKVAFRLSRPRTPPFGVQPLNGGSPTKSLRGVFTAMESTRMTASPMKRMGSSTRRGAWTMGDASPTRRGSARDASPTKREPLSIKGAGSSIKDDLSTMDAPPTRNAQSPKGLHVKVNGTPLSIRRVRGSCEETFSLGAVAIDGSPARKMAEEWLDLRRMNP